MTDKTPTQAVPQDGEKGGPDGMNRPGATGPGVTGRGGMGESGGGPYPNPHTGKSDKEAAKGFGEHGGQTVAGYHGTGQLGDKEVKPGGNVNAGGKTD